MQANNFVWAALIASACATDARQACDALLQCARTVNPWVVDGFAVEYGDDGRCWDQQDGAACEEACTDELVALWIPTGAPTCDPEPITGEPMLSEPQFVEAYWSLTCDLYASCTDRDTCDEDDEPPEVACYWGTFQPERAEDCLTVDPPRCVEEQGWAYVEISESCREVCAYDTTSTAVY